MRVRHPVTLSLTVCFSFLAIIVALIPPSSATGTGDYPYSGTGAWRITQDTSLTGENVTVNGDIIIESGARFLLVNSLIRMNCSYPNQYKVLVKSGGALEMVASAILPVNDSDGYRLVVEGQGELWSLSPEATFMLGAMVGAGLGFPLGIGATAYAYKRWFSRNLPPPV